MKCPKCKSAQLSPVTVKAAGAALARCTSCEGLWADKENIGKVLGGQAVLNLKIPRYAMQSTAQCPACEALLYEFCYPNTEILVDGCKGCQAIWFDLKEINAIKKAEKETVAVVCPRCHTDNHYNKNIFDTASCSSCGILFKSLFDRSGRTLPAKPEPLSESNPLDDTRFPEDIESSHESAIAEHGSIVCEWESVTDVDAEYKYCLYAIPSMLIVALVFNLSSLGAAIQRIWLGMPVHEFGHAVTAWFTGYNAIPSLWVTRTFTGSRGVIAPVLLCIGILTIIRYAKNSGSFLGLVLSCCLLLSQFIGTFVISRHTADMLIIFGGDGMGMVIATLLMVSFYYGKETNYYKGSLRWGFLAIGSAAFVDMYSVWLRALSDIGNVPYGTTGGRYTDSYRLVEHFGWTMDSLISRHIYLGSFCLAILAAVYVFELKKAKRIIVQYKRRTLE